MTTIKYLLVMAITIFVGVYAISFLVEKSKKPATCDKEHIYLCDTENVCQQQGLYWWDNSCHINPKPEPKPSEYPDYDSLIDMNSIVLIENFISYTPEGNELIELKDNDPYVFNGILLSPGKIIKGYIEIIASLKNNQDDNSDNKPLTNWESIYFKAPYYTKYNDKYGGHLFRPESLKLPPSEKTHLLFSLNNIPFIELPYIEFPEKKYYNNLFNTINQKEEITFLAFISSLRPAKIDSIKIYYECDKDYNDGNCKLELKQ